MSETYYVDRGTRVRTDSDRGPVGRENVRTETPMVHNVPPRRDVSYLQGVTDSRLVTMGLGMAWYSPSEPRS